ncbi:DNA excision repair protein ERCC-8-like isoform X2 [Convolutriloba macropyga]|uniref:DNA excision repair protein ERCC-8-like isoform X2 n=1 Tax=Convolutriloba macropyga TaxID=536237 RepID=UPI003F5215A2
MIPAYVFQRKYGADYRQGHILPSSNKSVIEKNYELLKPIIRNEFNILAQGQVTWIQLERSEHRYSLVSSEDGTISLYDSEIANSGNDLGQPSKPLAVLCSEHFIRKGLPDRLRKERKLFKVSPNSHSRCVSRVQWWPVDNGIFTSSGHDAVLNVWDANELEVVCEYTSSSCGIIYGHATNPSGSGVIAIATERHLLSCSPDDGLKLYDVRKGSVLMSYELSQLGQSDKSGPSSKKRDLLSQGHYAEQTLKSTLDFSPISSLFTSDGDSVVSLCSSGRLLHFNTASGTLIHNTTLRSKTVPSLLVYQFSTSRAHRADSVFIPNGSNILHRYNSKTGVVDQMTSAHFTGINCCELNDSQLKLLSSGKDREIVTWMATRKEKLVLDESEDLSDWDS